MFLSNHQKVFIDKSVHHINFKNAMSSKEETEFKKVLSSIGEEGKDWKVQEPFVSEEYGIIAVADFILPEQKIVLELDGKTHKKRANVKRDVFRDKIFVANGYRVIRIETPLSQDQKCYWKSYLQEIVRNS